MRLQKIVSIMLLLGLLLTAIPAVAQDNPPAPQFLYRSDNKLILLDGYTGETTELPITVAKYDSYTWSPDGKYLLALLDTEGRFGDYCLNLYDVNAWTWVYDKPISCKVREALFSADSTRIVYLVERETNGSVWLYSLTTETSEELYQTTKGDEIRPTGVFNVQWSSSETYLTFESYYTIMGGTLNTFVVMNVETKYRFTVQAPDAYYATYDPIWSADDRWFLLKLEDHYVTSSTVPHTNDKGDVYLVNSEIGGQYRLTYTPTVEERDIRWTADGNIVFTEVIEQQITFTPEEAMNVEVVPLEAIVTPEPVNIENFRDQQLHNVLVSPDPQLGAWVSSTSTQPGCTVWELNIGGIRPRDARFSVPIAEQHNNTLNRDILIGWRPTDQVYPQG